MVEVYELEWDNLYFVDVLIVYVVECDLDLDLMIDLLIVIS